MEVSEVFADLPPLETERLLLRRAGLHIPTASLGTGSTGGRSRPGADVRRSAVTRPTAGVGTLRTRRDGS